MTHMGRHQMTRQDGVVLVIVLLVTVLALGAFVFSAATLSLANRSGAAQERDATQALLAADSGVSTLMARVGAAGGVPSLDPNGGETVAGWIEEQFGTLDLGNGVTAAITATMTGSTVTVQSVGTTVRASRTVLQDFILEEGDGRPLSVNVPGALTSFSTIFGRGTAQVWGIGGTEDDWIFSGKWVPNAAPGQAPVLEPRLLWEASEGEYVQIGDDRYRVATAAGSPTGTASLVPLDGGIARPAEPGSNPVGLIPFALRGEPLSGSTMANGGVATLPVTEATFSLFDVDYPVNIGNGTGTIVDIDFENLTIDVEWEVAPTFGSIGEGNPLRRGVVSGITNGACDLGGSQIDFRDGCTPLQDLSNLFQQTFGELVEPEQVRDMSTEYPDLESIRNVPLSGFTWVDRVYDPLDPDATNLQDVTGEGVLIINNLSLEPVALNVRNEFQGLIYVIGNARLQGNQVSAGAVIVDGTAILDDEDLGDTAVAGTTDIRYDPFSLLQAIRSLTQPGVSDNDLQAVAGSWRIR